jgi:hypothetical protein
MFSIDINPILISVFPDYDAAWKYAAWSLDILIYDVDNIRLRGIVFIGIPARVRYRTPYFEIPISTAL